MLYCLNANILPQIRLINSVTITFPYVHKRRKANEYILYIIRKGSMYIKEDGKQHVLNEGDFFVLDPSYIHEGYKSSYCEYYYIHFKHPQIYKIEEEVKDSIIDKILDNHSKYLQSDSLSYESYENEELLIPKKYRFSNYNSFITTMCLLDEAIEANKDQIENYKILSSCKVLEAFIGVSRSFAFTEIEKVSSDVPKSYKKIQELLTYLNTEYYNKITGNTIENKFFCNFDYMNRIFKKLTNKTIFMYLNTVRINHAKELISTTSLTLAEISTKVGFSDEYYFSKVFKKYTGIPPTIYARGIQKTDSYRIISADFKLSP